MEGVSSKGSSGGSSAGRGFQRGFEWGFQRWKGVLAGVAAPFSGLEVSEMHKVVAAFTQALPPPPPPPSGLFTTQGPSTM